MGGSQTSYRRGQVEQAVARIQRVAIFDGQAPQNLRSDLKRLLDVDRAPRSKKLKTNTEPNAFFDDSEGPKKGFEVGYRAFHVFALLIAYRLVETGMTQSRTVAFMREIRADLEAAFDEMLRVEPRCFRSKECVDDDALMRLVIDGDLVEKADAMTFLIARAGSKPVKFLRMHPVYADLVTGNICTFSELREHLMRFDHLREGIVVLGLTNVAHQVVAVLARTTPPRKGRPASKKQETM